MITKTYWRQFAGWVIALKHKYGTDPFFKTEFNVVSLQILFATCLIIIVAIYFNSLFQDTTESLLENIISVVEGRQNVDSASIIELSRQEMKKSLFSFFGVAIALTVVFSYVIGRITLKPARTALKTQKRFISDIAHELRTPISVIKTNIEVTLIDQNIDPRIKAMLESNIEELDRTSEIINNLLSFNQLIRPGKMRFAEVHVGHVIDKSVAHLKQLAAKKHIEITVHKVESCVVFGNATAIEQIVTNLVKNAITYTSDGGFIKIVVEPYYGENVLISVEDTGVGISQDDLAHIFEPFYRAERSRNKNIGSGGSGLGLTIVSELVKLHSGRISIRSYPNKGTTVNVLLPINNATHLRIKEKVNQKNEVTVDFYNTHNT